jgi:hypothetical protein
VWELWQDVSVFLTIEFAGDDEFKGKSPFGEEEGTYTVQGDKLYMTGLNGGIEGFTYKLSGDVLTLTDDDGDDYEMHRRGTYMPADNNDNSGSGSTDDGTGLTLAALRQAAAATGYETGGYYPSGSMFLNEKPKGGFNVTFAPPDGDSYASIEVYFWEFASAAGAQAFKTALDEPDALFPKDHIVYERFVGQVPQGFSELDADIRAFVEGIFAAAGGGGAPSGNNGNVGAASNNLKLDIGKSRFNPGEEMTATVSGIEKNYEGDIYLCVFMCKPDFPIDQRPGDDYWWIRGTGTSSREFKVPSVDGLYEIRLYSNGDEPSAATFVTKVNFTVGTARP